MERFSLAEVIEGYMEMSDINLYISKEFLEAENQAIRIGEINCEVDKEET